MPYIADSMPICFTNRFLSTQILTKEVNFYVNFTIQFIGIFQLFLSDVT